MAGGDGRGRDSLDRLITVLEIFAELSTMKAFQSM